MALYDSGITQQPLMGSTQIGNILGSFAPVPNASMGLGAYPGAMLGSGATSALDGMYGDQLNANNAANRVGFTRDYNAAANDLFNRQQSAQVNSDLGGLGYAINQQGQGLQRLNQGRNQGWNNFDFYGNLFGLG